MRRIYCDACVLIYRVEGALPWARQAVEARMREALPGGLALCVTELLRLECRVQPMAQGDDELLARYDALFELPELIWQPLNREVFDLACRLRAQHRLKTPDALHLAAALTAGCDEFWTHDRRLAAAGEGWIQVIDISTDVPSDPSGKPFP